MKQDKQAQPKKLKDRQKYDNSVSAHILSRETAVLEKPSGKKLIQLKIKF
jgi:hypothetical protein